MGVGRDGPGGPGGYGGGTGGPLLRPYRGNADLAGVEAVRRAVRDVEGDVWMPGPGGPGGPGKPDERIAALPYCLVAEAGGQVIGYTWMSWWTEVDTTRLYLLLGAVAPAWRRRGLGTAMLRWQEARAAERAADEPGPGPAVLGGNADDSQPATRALLLAHGYTPAFTVLRMACDPRAADAPGPLPDGLELRPVGVRQHRSIHRAIEECFADSRYGHVPRTYGDYRADLASRQGDTSLWHVAWDGDRIAGVVVNEVLPDGSGLTPWVAIRAPWRRRGLARTLMRTGLRSLAERGVTRTTLTTIAENPNGSVELYRSVGYEVVERLPRYRKPLAAAGPPGPPGPVSGTGSRSG